MEWFKVEWKGPFSTDGSLSRPEAKGTGVYAIYGMRGREFHKLLYIGETFKQTFGKRLKQHERDWFENAREPHMAVCFGEVYLPKNKRLSGKRVVDVEGLLIHTEKPPFNTVSKRGYKGRGILVINTGKLGLLQPVATDKDNDDLIALLRKTLCSG